MTDSPEVEERVSGRKIDSIVADPLDASVARVRIGDNVYRIDVEVIVEQGLRVGAPIDEAAESALEEAALVLQVRSRALRLLTFRSYTARELSTRLRRADFPTEAIDRVIDWLQERQYIDDRRFAESWVRHRTEGRGDGPIRLRYELAEKGVHPAIIGEVIDEHFADGDTLDERAYRLAERRLEGLRNEPERRIYAKIYAYLQRRGYPGDVIRRTLRRIFDDPSLTRV